MSNFTAAGLIITRLLATRFLAGVAAALVTTATVSGGVRAADFVTSKVCQQCHVEVFEQWQGSHHQLAMQVATPATVLGDFSDRSFENSGYQATFSNTNKGFYVTTADSAGQPQQFTVTHTFGVYPLQQYLLDTSRGRKQALTIAWDSRPAAQGGQRWFDLLPNEHTPPGDELHWAGPLFNWNGMCAECHSTNLQVRYSAATDTFDTQFSEVSVGCEACHGPGSGHVTQAQQNNFGDAYGLSISLDDQADAHWVMNPETGIAERSQPATRAQQTEACGRCHARRSPLTKEYVFGKSLTSTHMPSLLEQNLYFSDGQIQDEVYVYGSFLQSRMYRAGVTCSNCHDPHSAELKTPENPSGVCGQCHLPATFAVAEHSPAQPQLAGNCVDCHMKARTYMGVDDRRDHSFRIPDAGLRPGHYGPVLAAAREGRRNANAALGQLATSADTPDIARATALALLSPPLTSTQVRSLGRHLTDPNPLIRIGALRALAQIPLRQRMTLGSDLLTDPILAVRIQAAQSFASDASQVPLDESLALQGAIEEARSSLQLNLFLPGNALTLAEFESRIGNVSAADSAYRQALKLAPQMAMAHHAYGLFLVRQKRLPEGLEKLKSASILAENNARFMYVYAVALNSTNQSAAALAVISNARALFPDNFDIGWALATMQRDSGQLAAARETAQHLASAFPGNPNVIALLRSLR